MQGLPTLLQLLRLLDRPDLDEIALQIGRAAYAKIDGAFRPVARAVFSEDQIVNLFVGTPLAQIVTRSAGRAEETLSLDGREYLVTIARSSDKLQVRIVERAPVPGSISLPSIEPAPAVADRRIPAAKQPVAVPVHVPVPRAAERPRTSRIVAALPTVSRDGDPSPYLAETIAAARARNASDVHIIAGRATCFRLVGKLKPQGDPLAPERVEEILLGLLNSTQRERFDDVGYTDFAVEIPGAGRARVNVSRQATGLKGCFRLIAKEVASLEVLGLPPELNKVTRYHQGLAIISGPSGHGKTTTMAALVDSINAHRAQHIITVEDPVEVIHPPKKALISQREIGAHTRSFATALKGALRQDPDVIVIGELRDVETVEVALGAAETGHLVLATMNTRTATTTIDRLISMFPPDKQEQVRNTLAGALMIVVSQRLLPNLNGDGMVAASELITGSVPLWNLIRDNKLLQLPNLQARGRSAGMIQLDTSLAELIAAEKISEETAMLYAENPKELTQTLAAARAPEPSSIPEPAARPAASALGGLFKRGSSS